VSTLTTAPLSPSDRSKRDPVFESARLIGMSALPVLPGGENDPENIDTARAQRDS
jgi:hypothetical protein